MKKYCLLPVLFFLLSSLPVLSQSITTLNTGWNVYNNFNGTWQKATVPGYVQTDIFSKSDRDSAFYANSNSQFFQVSESDWTYKCSFNADDKLLRANHVEVVFKGIDTYSRIYVNNVEVLETDNMFREFRVDIKHRLKPGKNDLMVIIFSPERKGNKRLLFYPYALPSPNDAGAIKTSSFTRKAPYQYGWDWSPRCLTMGIWRPVFLEAWNDGRIENVAVNCDSVNEASAYMTATVNWLNDENSKEGFELELGNATRKIEKVTGNNKTTINFKIDQPKLWWPNGFGDQPLYHFNIVLKNSSGLLDSFPVTTGIRKIELVQEKDNQGTSFYFKVNGKSIFMKGSNYVPPDIFPTQVTEADYQRLLDDATGVGMNMLRVWGGGTYEDDRFYRLCDEKGILIWQDFMFACAMYPSDSAFVENVKYEIRENIQRLRNHPCIALWCGNNEGEVAWKNWGWQKDFEMDSIMQSEIWNGYVELFQQIIPGIVNAEDHYRPYISTSPLSNWGNHENFKHHNMHYWGVWHGEEAIDSFRVYVPRFMTEYGMQSFPSYQTLKKNGGAFADDLNSEYLKSLQKSYKGNKLLLKYVEQSYGTPADVAQLAYYSQLTQAEALKIAIESHRKNAGYCMGTLYWQLNDSWDGASWSTIEHDGTWKAAYYKLKSLYAPNILVAEVVNDTFRVFLQSDAATGLKGRLQVDVMNFNGSKAGQFSKNTGTGYLTANKIFELPVSNLVKDKNKNELVVNVQFFSSDTIRTLFYFDKPVHLQLKKPDIKYQVTPIAQGVTITLTSNILAKDVFVDAGTISGKFSDNYFDLLPGETKTISFKSADFHYPQSTLKVNSFFWQR